eukprot:Clim_evm6s51 gene=Clim_evmTU6s51
MGRENAQDRRKKRVQRKEKKLIKELKEARKEAARAENFEEEDLDAIIAELDALETEGVELDELGRGPACITRTLSEHPKHRINFLMNSWPSQSVEQLFVFGGERMENHKHHVNNELLTYKPSTNEWSIHMSSYAPKPRCGHHGAVRPVFGGQIFVFGGEFTSPTGSQFRHYNDLWLFHVEDRKWEQIKQQGDIPSPRSGHRMILIPGPPVSIVLFGGFHDDGKGTPKYFNDLYALNLETYSWTKIDFGTTIFVPSPRSAMHFVTERDARSEKPMNSAYLLGGYSRKRVKGEIEKGEVHADVWRLVFDQSLGDELKNQFKWETVRLHGAFPKGSGFASSISHRGHLLLFGGVVDMENEESLRGHFQCGFQGVNFGRSLVYDITVKEGVETKEIMEKIEEIHSRKQKAALDRRNLLKASKGKGKSKKGAVPPQKLEAEERKAANADAAMKEEVKELTKEVKPEEWPSPRANAGLTTIGKTLYLYSGYYEKADRSVTYSDLWSIDMENFQSWKLLQSMDAYETGSEESSSDEDDDSDDDE